jgi:hypothetical protein
VSAPVTAAERNLNARLAAIHAAHLARVKAEHKIWVRELTAGRHDTAMEILDETLARIGCQMVEETAFAHQAYLDESEAADKQLQALADAEKVEEPAGSGFESSANGFSTFAMPPQTVTVRHITAHRPVSAEVLEDERSTIAGAADFIEQAISDITASAQIAEAGGPLLTGRALLAKVIAHRVEEPNLGPLDLAGTETVARRGDLIHVIECDHQGEQHEGSEGTFRSFNGDPYIDRADGSACRIKAWALFKPDVTELVAAGHPEYRGPVTP